MNTAISLDINVFREAEREAESLRITIPEFCSVAIREFVKNNNKTTITRQLDDFYSNHKVKLDDDIIQAQYDLLGEEDW
ncbi:MAG: hypothetical protein FWD13_10485 [Treponema sp.]|nr:hypothetical protein [Treponema sp.]